MSSSAHNRFDLARLRTQLKPFRLYWFPRLRSTNDHAAALRKRGELFAPAVVLTGHQTAGRGRGAHTWWSGQGALTVTFALPIEEHLAAHQLPLVAGLAVRNALSELSGVAHLALKWPNDVLYEGRKVAGVLCERIHRIDLVGIGVNLNSDPEQAPIELQQRITSLYAITGRLSDPTASLITLAQHLLRTVSRRSECPFAALLKEYDRHHALVGRDVTVQTGSNQPPVCGQCEGLDQVGRLMVRDRRHLHRIVAGHVEMAQGINGQ